MLSPTSQMRTLRELEPPSTDEGFASVETVPFVRAPANGAAGVYVAARAVDSPGFEAALGKPGTPRLVYDWRPDDGPDSLRELAIRFDAEAAVCPHGAGPPTCWCRPPLPGLPLAFARKHGVDPARSVVIGVGPAHRQLAGALGARYVEV
jgi:hypothetical protein